MDKSKSGEDKACLIASKKNWIEGEALRQLKRVAELPGIIRAVGLPDIHPGKGIPVGAAFISKDITYPHLIGNDIGCGVGLWKTDLKKHNLKLDKWAKRLSGLESRWQGDRAKWLYENGIESSGPNDSLGTIGGGNHFAELQAVHEIHDLKLFEDLQLDKKFVMVVVHSGSREIGDSIFRYHAEKCGARGLDAGSDDAANYLGQHNFALKWAEANRALIALRMCEQLGTEGNKVLDVFHNSISKLESRDSLWLHRKGAVPSDRGPLLIPGTRGSLSYIVNPVGKQDKNVWSLAHGAGRKWNRTTSRDLMKSRHSADSLLRTNLGSWVICENKDLLYEEAPQAYKNIDIVIEDMIAAGLISIIATLKPLITYKVRNREET